LVDSKRGTKRRLGAGGAGDSSRPRIPSSHGGRSDDLRAVPRPPRRPALPTNGVARARAAEPGPRLRKARTASPGAAPSSLATEESRGLAIAIAAAALDKKAISVEVLDVSGRVDYADFLVLMTGRSDRQVNALAQGIEEALRLGGKRPLSVEGLPHAHWVLMDYGDVVVHVFQDEARSTYDLEGLWMDARRIPVPIPEGAS
jgi:ribosome-associated protein